ncbi:MAG TPA: TonB-dependent receptor [Vicinamibacterales bacterium]|nr:TonB-dependent receptor [Vicinamibacterales bacterium]
MKRRSLALAVSLALLAVTRVLAQDTTGTIEGVVTDKTGGVVAGARLVALNVETGFTKEAAAGTDGFYRLLLLPIGQYTISVSAPQFATLVRESIQVSVSQTVRLNLQLELSSVAETVTVAGEAQLVDTTTNALGRVVTGAELVDLPLNGRNFTQLGLLQTGVAPLTQGVATAGGSLRQGQAYAVNGMRPEQNMYLVDGAQNINRMDGGYALKLPVEAIAEFRILTQSAPAEYGGTGGATTSVVTRSGGNQLHGAAYDFVRNDVFDARNFFSAEVEPLNQNQFGGTIGGPITRDRLQFFGYYEGFRNKQGFTTSATVPTPQERQGDFSGLGTPLLNLAAGGVPIPGNRIPGAAINPVARNVINLYPLGNVSPSIYRETVIITNVLDQAGGRIDWNLSPNDQVFGRYSYSGGHNINPVSVRGTDVPGFPTRDDFSTHIGTLASTHIFSSSLMNSLRGTFLRHKFFFDQRLNQTPPSALGFGYVSSNEVGQGPPFFNVSGYSPIGGAITGPRNTTQNTFELQESLSWTKGSHLVKLGGEFRRTSIDMIQAIAPNAFYVFAGTFPTNNAIANLLLGAPVTFYQGLGDFSRGVRVWGLGAYAQDEWRVTPNVTLNYGVRYERINPLTEIEDRQNAFVPGAQSVVRPEAPVGLLFPGDPGITRGIAESVHAFMPRVGAAWDPTGTGTWSVRASYGLFYDQFQNGAGTASQVAISATPWAQFVQFSGAGLNFQNPYQGRQMPAPETFVRPSTVFALDADTRPPYVQNWNVSVQRSLFDRYLIEVRYVGAAGRDLPRNVEANPAVYGPGATAQNADRRRIYANCPPGGAACDFSTIAMLRSVARSRYDAGQLSLSRRFGDAFGFNVSYWLSKTMDHLSAMNLSGAAARPLAGENDLAQNPFDLEAEWGPSLFDARHRFVASVSWMLPDVPDRAPGVVRALFDGWQFNAIGAYNSGTPFTVSDSANVALQANSPPVSGFPASRPNLVGDPNAGPRTVNEWISRSAFQRLNIQTDAGQFGNAGRNIARGPSYTNIDVALVRDFQLNPEFRLQLRAEVFNVANGVNFGLPVADLNSPNFGRILSAGPARLMQFGLKLIF